MKAKLSLSTTHGVAMALLCAASVTSQVSAQGADSVRQDQMRAELQKRFTAADTNADGKLTREEAKRGMPRIYRSFDAIDTAKTGSVSLEQITAFAEQQSGRR